MIEAENLSFSYKNGYPAIQNVSFTVEEGQSVGLIGANGAGKSTLLKLMLGLLENAQGRLCVNGRRVEKKNLAAIRRDIGYVFQDSDSQLFLSTVYEDVAFGPRNCGYSEQEVERRVRLALERVHLTELQDRQIYRLSGGQKKLAAIATILSMEPKLLLLDEPSIALDPRNRRNLIGILNEMQETKIIASHDLDLILDVCRHTILICDGRVVRSGKTEDILQDEELLLANGLELPLRLQGR
jgi:cobalt/nickel transport system ATP-binding protein